MQHTHFAVYHNRFADMVFSKSPKHSLWNLELVRSNKKTWWKPCALTSAYHTVLWLSYSYKRKIYTKNNSLLKDSSVSLLLYFIVQTFVPSNKNLKQQFILLDVVLQSIDSVTEAENMNGCFYGCCFLLFHFEELNLKKSKNYISCSEYDIKFFFSFLGYNPVLAHPYLS